VGEDHRLCDFRPKPQEGVQDGALALHLEKALNPEATSNVEDEFYNNEDLLSHASSSKQDSTKKYIELVDSFRQLSKQKETETPSFKAREGENKRDVKQLKFEDVLNEDSKGTQRSSNILTERVR
jgi:hypothetical protein